MKTSSTLEQVLLIIVQFTDGRYHGNDNAPSPSRLFQALVAGAGLSGDLTEDFENALSWLEKLEPPTVALPQLVEGQTYSTWVPNNDLDAKGGDPNKIGGIRAAKRIAPKLFNPTVPFLYGWRFKLDDQTMALTICELSEKLYQLGRGVDMAWAFGEILATDEFEVRLDTHQGLILRPTPGGHRGRTLSCPAPGSLQSLKRRHEANSRRFSPSKEGSKTVQVFRRRPKSLFREVTYESPPRRFVFELRSADTQSTESWPLEWASRLVSLARDEAKLRLTSGSLDTEWNALVDRVLIGRPPSGRNSGPRCKRVRLYPLASIGHGEADRRLRRLLLEVPPGCPISPGDVKWAFAGAAIQKPGESSPCALVLDSETRILSHYGSTEPFRVWRSVTPVALPYPEEKKARISGSARATRELRLQQAVNQALRHAGLASALHSVTVRKEPFEKHGKPAEEFATGTRFAAERLWHVELTFEKPQKGILALGDGRFLGLGLCAPVVQKSLPEVLALSIRSGLSDIDAPDAMARYFRSALLSRIQRVLGPTAPLDPYFSGHTEDGRELRDSPHLAVHYDPQERRFIIVMPSGSGIQANANRRKVVFEAVLDFSQLKAGKNGSLTLSESVLPLTDPLLRTSRRWVSLTPYRVNRHAKTGSDESDIIEDVRTDCRRRGYLEPQVQVTKILKGKNRIMEGSLILDFPVAVTGPLMLGRTRFLGGGLFRAQEQSLSY